MKAKIQYMGNGFKLSKQICKKYNIPFHSTINGWWIYEISNEKGDNKISMEQYDKLNTAEESGYLKRTLYEND